MLAPPSKNDYSTSFCLLKFAFLFSFAKKFTEFFSVVLYLVLLIKAKYGGAKNLKILGQLHSTGS